MRGTEFESAGAGGAAWGTEGLARHEMVSRLRLQVATGAYEPPVDKLVDRLMTLVLAGYAAMGPGPSR